MTTDELLIDYFGENKYRPLDVGEKILSGDVFIQDYGLFSAQDNGLHSATDIGNGVFSTQHFPHYRLDT
ncbi:MAG: hypothetical protein GY746_07515 [Gammaproteobacteria bacterium]|nr:hypothetical protein [Gammaproteobacteria bacterium]